MSKELLSALVLPHAAYYAEAQTGKRTQAIDTLVVNLRGQLADKDKDQIIGQLCSLAELILEQYPTGWLELWSNHLQHPDPSVILNEMAEGVLGKRRE